MKKHLFVILALAAIVGVGIDALAADPPAEKKSPPRNSKVAADEPKENTTARPSARADGTAEFNEPTRSPEDRIVWVYQSEEGMGKFENTEGSTWIEDHPSGVKYTFTEVTRNVDFIEISDNSRQCRVRMYDTKTLIKQPEWTKNQWLLLYPGVWQSPVAADGATEFNEPTRSPADNYAGMDPAFAKFVDLSILAEAMAGPNASLLADVALGLAEGERVLVRNHRMGLTADAIMAKVVKLAARSNDKATLDRISKASTSLSKPQWAKLVTEAKEFGGVSRDGPMVALGKVDVSTVALLERVRQACGVAELTGQKESLEGLKKEVAASAVDSKVKVHAADLIDSTLKGLPETSDETGKLLSEFSSPSRQFDIFGKGSPLRETPVDPRTWDRTAREIDRARLDVMTPGPRAGRDYTRFHIRNSTPYRLRVALTYYPYVNPRESTSRLSSGSGGGWMTNGWWELAPGESAYLVDTPAASIYYFAESLDGRYTWNSPSGLQRMFGGRQLGFRIKAVDRSNDSQTLSLTVR